MRALGGSRTHTSLAGYRVLSPARLPDSATNAGVECRGIEPARALLARQRCAPAPTPSELARTLGEIRTRTDSVLGAAPLPLGHEGGYCERLRGVEPRSSPWRGDALPLSHNRVGEPRVERGVSCLRGRRPSPAGRRWYGGGRPFHMPSTVDLSSTRAPVGAVAWRIKKAALPGSGWAACVALARRYSRRLPGALAFVRWAREPTTVRLARPHSAGRCGCDGFDQDVIVGSRFVVVLRSGDQSTAGGQPGHSTFRAGPTATGIRMLGLGLDHAV